MLENVQAEDRVHRVGSERHESVTVVDIIAPDTIEVRQLQKLREKATRLEEIVRDRDRLAKAGYSTAELDHEEQQLLAGHLLGG
jgi:SNF2 family DNA or RNA helicase